MLFSQCRFFPHWTRLDDSNQAVVAHHNLNLWDGECSRPRSSYMHPLSTWLEWSVVFHLCTKVHTSAHHLNTAQCTFNSIICDCCLTLGTERHEYWIWLCWSNAVGIVWCRNQNYPLPQLCQPQVVKMVKKVILMMIMMEVVFEENASMTKVTKIHKIWERWDDRSNAKSLFVSSSYKAN